MAQHNNRIKRVGLQDMKQLDARQQLMVITMEECGELQQVCSKILRQATVENKRQELVDELGDVLCMISLMQEHDLVSWQELEDRAEVKREKLSKWSDLV
jgi:NTP pyrophosphatase (non-canonical NTP hydrolase)